MTKQMNPEDSSNSSSPPNEGKTAHEVSVAALEVCKRNRGSELHETVATNLINRGLINHGRRLTRDGADYLAEMTIPFVCYVGFHCDGYDLDNEDRRAVVSIGATRREAQSLAIQRSLGMCLIDGAITTVRQELMDGDTYAKIRVHLDAFFKEKGLP